MMEDEPSILKSLDELLRPESVRSTIDAIASQLEQELMRNHAALMTWQPVARSLYRNPVPTGIQSSLVFILRTGATTGAERHPNSHQRVMSYRGCGDLQVNADGQWRSNLLVSDYSSPLTSRWASIPVNVWHQAVVPADNWVVVSFHTAPAHDLIEERPAGQRVSSLPCLVVERHLHIQLAETRYNPNCSSTGVNSNALYAPLYPSRRLLVHAPCRPSAHLVA